MGSLALSFLAGAALAFAAVVWYVRSRRAPVSPLIARLEPPRQPRSHTSIRPSSLVDERPARRSTPGRGFRASIASSLMAPLGVAGVEAQERELADDLRGYLGDIAAQHGADHVMLWLRTSGSAPYQSVASSSGGATASSWGTEQQRALIGWAASEGVVTFDTASGTPSVAASRVDLDAVLPLGDAARAGGALVLHAEAGIRGSRADLKLWLPRHAQRLAQLVELQVTRNEVARANRELRLLARNAQEMEIGGEQETLERRIADNVVEAARADFAALVAWDAEMRRGALHRVTPGYPEPLPATNQRVEADSLVGSVCLDGNPLLWEDARTIAGEPLFAAGSLVPNTGTIAILPLQRGGHTVGAIVIGAKEPGMIKPSDLRMAKQITQLASSALEAVWSFEVVRDSAVTDQLTGLGNRRHFDESLRRVLNEVDRYRRTCALVLADLDEFKKVNDELGHEAGDEVLKLVADVLREVVRTTDICARIGGEEFCVVVPETTLEGAAELAERIRADLSQSSVSWKGREIRVTASFGVATYTAGSGVERRGQLFQSADKALYRAKAAGRNCVRAE
ncbi:MAG TPA: sensor domain-containing diguanylate cyclase [Gemmatimonadaceae bacterium]|nr:sensor domain-containing diguanylate cyclase [Gemmatimonadaceae bacterium]